MTAQLETLINAAWDDRAALSQDTKGETRDAIEAAIMALDSGEMRVASKAGNGDWTVHQWLKKAVLLGFRIHPNAVMTGGPQGGHFFDKVPSKFEGWTEADFKKAAFRVVPPATVRRGSYRRRRDCPRRRCPRYGRVYQSIHENFKPRDRRCKLR